MHSFEELGKIIHQHIAALPEGKQPATLYQPIDYFMQLGGKRTRPVLLLTACEVLGGQLEDAIQPAIAIELFHNFTLLHDDIMDNSPLRRNKPTVHEKWNENIAILSGDAMFVQAVQHMMMVKPEVCSNVMSVFLSNAIKVCEGQQYDMDFETESRVSIASYLQMIELKTAVLIGASLQIGAIIAGANHSDASNMYEFGKNIGLAFQLQDDILDVYGDESLFGKKRGRDIVANKKTYLLIKAMELASGEQKVQLDKLISDAGIKEEDKINRMIALYDSLQVRALAEAEMENFYQHGISCLEKISAQKQDKDQLHSFASALMQRTH